MCRSTPPNRRHPSIAGWPLRGFAAVLLGTLGLALGGCRGKAAPTDGTSETGAATPPPSASAAPARRPREAPRAAARVSIPEGRFLVGSLPGEAGRTPGVEPRRSEVELGPFRIDRLPYPNQPGAPPRVGVTRDEAARLCAEREQRLCTEVEWERACRGPEGDAFAGAAAFDERCSREPESCASGFDVLALGSALREWTASEARGPTKGPVIKGAAAAEPGPLHRCGTRRVAPAASQAPDLGFRCCEGPPNATLAPEPVEPAQRYRRHRLEAARLEKLLAEEPRTRELARDVVFFREPDAANTVIARGPGDRKGFDFTVLPLLWSPAPGVELMIVAARSGKDTSFVLAYWVLGDDSYQLAASFVMKREPGPVALAYSESIPPRMHFSTCWGCPGETGKLLFREPESVVILQP